MQMGEFVSKLQIDKNPRSNGPVVSKYGTEIFIEQKGLNKWVKTFGNEAS